MHKIICRLSLLPIIPPLLTLSACHHQASEETGKAATPPPVLTVSAYEVTTRPLQQSVSLTGSIQARELVTVQPAATGLKVLRVLADEGDYVRQGQLLVQLDDRLLQSQLASARNRVSSSNLQYAKTRQPNRSQDIARLQAAVNQAEVSLNDAITNQERTDRLYAEQVVTQAERDSRHTAVATAQAVLKQQRAALNLALAGSRSEDLNLARLTISDARNQLDQLGIQIDQTQVRAPVAGLILSRDVSQGEISSFAGRYFTMVKNGVLEFRAQVPEADLFQVPIGARVSIASEANPGIKATGIVRRLGAAIDQTSRLGTVRIDVQPGSGLKVGQFVRGELELGQGRHLVVPIKSVTNLNGKSFVYLLQGNKAKAQEIRTGSQSRNSIEVLSGLKSHDKIIEDGVGFIKDGDVVKIVQRPQVKVTGQP